ncbi:MAG: hypothetical protein ACLVHV_02320 [Oscillospiraceae bacterium]
MRAVELSVENKLIHGVVSANSKSAPLTGGGGGEKSVQRFPVRRFLGCGYGSGGFQGGLFQGDRRKLGKLPVQEGKQRLALTRQAVAQLQTGALGPKQEQRAGVIGHAPGVRQQGTGILQNGAGTVQLRPVFFRGQGLQGRQVGELRHSLRRFHQTLLLPFRTVLPLPPEGAELRQAFQGHGRVGGYGLGQERPFLHPGGQAGRRGG